MTHHGTTSVYSREEKKTEKYYFPLLRLRNITFSTFSPTCGTVNKSSTTRDAGKRLRGKHDQRNRRAAKEKRNFKNKIIPISYSQLDLQRIQSHSRIVAKRRLYSEPAAYHRRSRYVPSRFSLGPRPTTWRAFS